MIQVTERGARPATHQSEYYTEDVYGHHNEALEFNVLGVDFSKRGVRSEESTLAMRALWRDGHASFHGTKVSFPEVLSYPQPVQRDGVPIRIGGYAPVAARRAGRVGDGFFPIGGDTKALVATMREEARRHRRNPDIVELTLMAGEATLDAVKAAQDLGAQRVMLRAPAFEPEPLHKGMEKIANEIIAKI